MWCDELKGQNSSNITPNTNFFPSLLYLNCLSWCWYCLVEWFFLNKLEQYLFTDFFYYFCIGIIWYQYGMILILKHASQKIRAELKPLSLSLSVVLIQCNLREKQFIILYLDKYTSPYTYTIVTNFNYTAFALRMLFEKYNWGHAPFLLSFHCCINVWRTCINGQCCIYAWSMDIHTCITFS